MDNTSLLELAKKFNIPRRNRMKTKERLEEAIKDTISIYKEIILVRIPSPVWHVWMKLESSKSLIKKI